MSLTTQSQLGETLLSILKYQDLSAEGGDRTGRACPEAGEGWEPQEARWLCQPGRNLEEKFASSLFLRSRAEYRHPESFGGSDLHGKQTVP